MRNLHSLDNYRDTSRRVVAHYGHIGDSENGVFLVPSCTDRQNMMVIASCGIGWEHVSVSRKNRTPNWPEMEQIKRLFFKDDETCMQLHVPVSDHISVHSNCLHIWRPTDKEIPRPPSWTVGGDPDSAERELQAEINRRVSG